jgi:patatin-like phospholipase/acyl hydrolase
MPAEKPVKILSIDGGGIRGIIPALVLAEIERRTERPACELFDLIAGTSTGGIIALGVTVPGEAGPDGDERPRWRAKQLAELYVSEGPKIFHRSCARKITTVDGLREERYPTRALEAALERYMGDALLSQALTDVLITSYDVEQHEPLFFKSFQPPPRAAASTGEGAAEPAGPTAPTSGYPMKVVGRATSAAPTYFEPEHVLALAPGESPPDYALVDGGTFANNPAMCAYAEAMRKQPGADVLIVSLGTGRLTESISFEQAKRGGLIQWATRMLGVMMDGASATIDYQLDELLGHDVDHFRFQTLLDGVSDSLDDARPRNIAGLRKLAENSITHNGARLNEVCKRLI